MSVRPHGTTRLPLDEFSSNLIFERISKIQISLKYDKNGGYFTWRHMYIYGNISLKYFFFRMRIISDKSCRENQKTHSMFSNLFFFFENRAVYEIMWKNMVDQESIACCIPKATDTH